MLQSLSAVAGNLSATAASLARIALLSNLKVSLPEPEDSRELVILGNGPSLTASLEKHLEYFQRSTLLCVNNFPLSAQYGVLKPSYLTLAAPEFFMETPPTEHHAMSRAALFEAIRTRTTWPLYILASSEGKRSVFWREQFRDHPQVRVAYFNTTPVEGFRPFRHLLFRSNLGMPRPHNVLIPSIVLGINMGYKRLVLFGADHSWHEEIRGADGERVTVDHKHFYDAGSQVMPMYKLDGQEYYMHDVLRKLYLAFSGYHTLRAYAAARGVEILNASERSYIDAFEKVRL